MDPRREILSDKEALEFIIDLLAQESPRFMHKCIDEAKRSFELYNGIGGVSKTLGFRYADVIAITFLKIKHTDIFNFILRNFDSIGEDLRIYFQESFKRRDFVKSLPREESFKLIKYISHNLKTDLKISEPERIEQIFALSFRFWYDEIYGSNITRKIVPEISMEARNNVFSNPKILKNFLLMVNNPVTNPVADAVDIYNKHIKDKIILSEISRSDLVNYARVLRDIESPPIPMYMDVAQSILDRIFKDINTLKPRMMFESLRETASYQFSFQILEIIERSQGSNQSAENKQKAIQLFKSFLSAQEIDTGSKLMILSSFADNEKGGASDINWRLNKAFDEMLSFDSSLYLSVKEVFNEYSSRYVGAGNKIVYEHEENFFFVIYQTWSGKLDQSELLSIHNMVKRGLMQFPDVITAFWKRFPFQERWLSSDTSVILDDLRYEIIQKKSTARELYIRTEDLIKITERSGIKDNDLLLKMNFWKNFISKPEVKELFELKEDFSTLRAILVKRGIFDHK